MFESNYNYVPNPYPPAPHPGPQPGYHPYPQPMPGPGPVVPPPIYIDPTLSIPGAAADAAVTGKLLAAKLSIDKLTGTIKLINDKLEIDGFVDAESGQVPSKGEDGSIEWIDAARESDVISIKEDLQSQLTQLTSELNTAKSNIDELFTVNAQQNTSIANLTELVNNLSDFIMGDDEHPGLQERVETLESEMETKLDAATFNEVINGEDGLISRVTELEGCCEEVQQLLQNILNALGGPENYDQPIYQTLADFETHLQALQRNFDGGDIDDEIENPDRVEVPDLIGMKYAAAELLLGQLGLFTQYSNGDDELPEGMSKDSLIYDYEPQDEVARGSVITIDVNWQEEDL